MTFNKPRPGPGQESVWDYPRPPRLELCRKPIRVVFNEKPIATTERAQRVLETSHPPVYYLPPSDILMDHLVPEPTPSYCEWKGIARYYSVEVDGKRAERAAWCYPDPTPEFASLRDHVAFYAGPMDECLVDGVRVRPQPGGFYGGWITPDVLGPFKGEPGTAFW